MRGDWPVDLVYRFCGEFHFDPASYMLAPNLSNKASGHVNPSLPVARALVAEGHQVHYLSQKPMREAIEATGASFSSDFEARRGRLAKSLGVPLGLLGPKTKHI